MHPNLYFFASTVCWNFSDGHPNFLKGSSVGDCLRRSSPGTPGLWLSGAGVVCGPLQEQGMYAYYLMHGWVRLFLNPLACGAELHISHKGIFVHGCMPYCCGEERQESDVFFSHLAYRMLLKVKWEKLFEYSKAPFILTYSAIVHSNTINALWSILSFSKYLLNIYSMSIYVPWHGLNARDY